MYERRASMRVVQHKPIVLSPGERFANGVMTTLDFTLTVVVRTLRYAPHTAFLLLIVVLWYMTPHAVLAELARLRLPEMRVGILSLIACSAVVGLLSASLTPERR